MHDCKKITKHRLTLSSGLGGFCCTPHLCTCTVRYMKRTLTHFGVLCDFTEYWCVLLVHAIGIHIIYQNFQQELQIKVTGYT